MHSLFDICFNFRTHFACNLDFVKEEVPKSSTAREFLLQVSRELGNSTSLRVLVPVSIFRFESLTMKTKLPSSVATCMHRSNLDFSACFAEGFWKRVGA